MFETEGEFILNVKEQIHYSCVLPKKTETVCECAYVFVANLVSLPFIMS